jgi:hypothetical protein
MAGIDEVSHKMTYALRLLPCVRSLMAHRDVSLSLTALVAIGGIADIHGLVALAKSVVNDPLRSLAGQICCDAQDPSQLPMW